MTRISPKTKNLAAWPSPISADLLSVDSKDLQRLKIQLFVTTGLKRCFWLAHSTTHLSRSLQVPKVDIRNEEDRLRVQVGHRLQQGAIGSLNRWVGSDGAVFPWSTQYKASKSISPSSIKDCSALLWVPEPFEVRHTLFPLLFLFNLWLSSWAASSPHLGASFQHPKKKKKAVKWREKAEYNHLILDHTSAVSTLSQKTFIWVKALWMGLLLPLL